MLRRSSPSFHQALQTEIASSINELGRPRRLARAFTELRVTFGGRSLVPDVAVYRWERLPRDEHGELMDVVVIPPDLSVEILSPGQSRRASTERCAWYVQHGVQLAWLVDPDTRTIREYRPGAPGRLLVTDDRLDLSPLLPGQRLAVSTTFEALRGE